MGQRDPFSGTWAYRPELSQSSGPKLARWVQWIEATAENVRVREEVVVATGRCANVSLEARFDGKDYPVTGSSLSETIAYTRDGRSRILGIGKKNGSVTLRETMVAGEDGKRMTVTFSILSDNREVMNGVAVFERQMS